MDNDFFKAPVLNSPYEYSGRHWELDNDGQPTQKIIAARRRATFITPVPKPRKRGGARQNRLVFDEGRGLSTKEQQYDPTAIINGIREQVNRWRALPPSQWRTTAETARLLQHWRSHRFNDIRPFFCQIEAVETAIWLTEVAPQTGKDGKRFLQYLADASEAANPGLNRLALKLATGAGKTTVIAMLIAWQTINAVRHPQSKRFTRGFLVVTPGITIRDRLRVLQPNDPYSYYQSRELVPQNMLSDLDRARIVITNYHAFKQRERMQLSRGTRALLQGRAAALPTLETEGQMLQRVMPELMGIKNPLVFNDEAHHCYREKPESESDEAKPTGDDRREAEKNREAARLWLSGLAIVNRKLGIGRVFDLSATPFFLSGSGYAEGTLFPWTVSDFSLMDAIECGIVKLPRVPVADNFIKREQMPMYRDLWSHIRDQLPQKGRRKNKTLNPLELPSQLLTALDALYGHYRLTFNLWQQSGSEVPPCFIIVCNNTATSKLVYDYVSGFHHENEDGSTRFEHGKLQLFQNHDQDGNPLGRPRTLLIDSEQLESGDALDQNFRTIAKDEIERFRREIVKRTGDRKRAENIADQELLREVMNTVGKPGRLGESIRCVVSVSMLTEGWDANTVTHVLGVRAFGTQLLCEQVIGRALRRRSYDLNEDQRLQVEYADVLGIPFDFTAKPVVVPPQPPPDIVQVKAVRPERDALEIRFPRLVGYQIELPQERLAAEFNADSTLKLTPELVGATETRNAGIIGEEINLTLDHTDTVRELQVAYKLTAHLLLTHWRDGQGEPKLYLFGQLKRIVRQWLREHLECAGQTNLAQLKYKTIADMACERIMAGIVRAKNDRGQTILAVPDAYNPVGTTAHVNFGTSRTSRYKTDPRRCHINWIITDSEWEAEFCRLAEAHPRVRAYVKNHNLGLEVPYRRGSEMRSYIPDFIVVLDDGHGEADPLHLIVEIKGYRGEDAKDKKTAIETLWVPSVNRHGQYGRWAFAEFTDAYRMQADFGTAIAARLDELLELKAASSSASAATRPATAGGTEPDLEESPRRRSGL